LQVISSLLDLQAEKLKDDKVKEVLRKAKKE
jgi:two-component sensor histidine kinase